MATSYQQPGQRIVRRRGDYDAALDWYRKALAIDEQLGDRAGMAGSYHQLGIDRASPRRHRRGARLVPQVAGDLRDSSATAPAWPAPTTSWASSRKIGVTTT